MTGQTIHRACRNCDELQERIRQLEAELYGRHWQSPVQFGLTSQEDKFLAALVAYPGVRGCDTLFDACTNGGADEDERKRLVTVIACRIRRKTRPFGITINTHYGRGYSLTQDSRNRLLAWNQEQAA